MNQNRPTSENELGTVLKSADDFASKFQYDEALNICNWLIEDPSTEVAGYRQRAAIKEQMKDLNGAIHDLQSATSRFDKEPSDFHSLGLLLLQNGATVLAIDAFGSAIALGEEANYHYYTNSSLLLRADAHLKRTNFAEALADVMRLPTGYQVYIPGSGMRTKEQISAEASMSLEKKAKMRGRNFLDKEDN